MKSGEPSRLTRISSAAPRRSVMKFALYQCACGKTIEVNVYSVDKGRTRSCGCLRREHAKRLSQT